MMNKCFKLFTTFALLIGVHVAAQAQDERYFRDLLSGDFTRELPPEVEPPRFRAFSEIYELDLTGNHRFERIVFEMRDGQDWLSIFDYQKKPIFRYSLGPNAGGSRVYRLRHIQINPTVQALVVYYFEGVNTYLGIQSNARAHILTYEPVEIEKTINGFKGPAFWEEFQNGREQYRRRSYDLEFTDLNGSGTKEMVVRFQNISRVFQFEKSGFWKLL